MKYCQFCGKQLEDNEVCACANGSAQVNTKRTKSKKKYIAIGVAVLLGIIALLVLFFALGQDSDDDDDRIDPFDYMKVSFTGFNSIGEVEIDFDEVALVEGIVGEVPEDIEGYDNWVERYNAYLDDIDVTCSEEEGLSNGDTVTVTISVSGDARDDIKAGKKTYKVKGLGDLQTVDVFEDLEVTFEGISGEAKVNLKRDPSNKALTHCDLEISKDYYLSIGETVIISVTNVDEVASDCGYLIEETSKEYTVPVLDQYVNDPNMIPKEKLQAVADEFVIAARKKDEGWLSYTAPEYYRTYLFVAKPGEMYVEKSVLEVYVSYDTYYNGEFWETRYTSLDFKNLILRASGELELAYEDGVSATYTTDMEGYLTEREEKYYVHEIVLD